MLAVLNFFLDILAVSVAKCELNEHIFVLIAIIAKCYNKRRWGVCVGVCYYGLYKRGCSSK